MAIGEDKLNSLLGRLVANPGAGRWIQPPG
jgi:hypothetical protein